jgi:co-chaperonin GroES (HSP10)
MKKLQPIGITILFQFLDETNGAHGSFSERTRSGLIIPTLSTTQKGERWGKVIAVGPKVEGILPGDFVMVEPLMWTRRVELDGENIWKTNTDKIMMVTSDIKLTVQY